MINILVYNCDAERIEELADSYGVSIADFVEALVDDVGCGIENKSAVQKHGIFLLLFIYQLVTLTIW